MGTRGILGVRVDRRDKIAYNHFDSYPDGLGKGVIDQLADLLKDPTRFRGLAKDLQPIDPQAEPTENQIHRLKKFTDLRVSRQSPKDWYCLLRKTQGDLGAILEATMYENAEGFTHDSLFCEYGYIANLDEDVLEFYIGFQKSPHTKGRFAAQDKSAKDNEISSQYYGIALIGTIPFAEIAADPEKAFEKLSKMSEDYHATKNAA